jgi:hypothetical protein
MLSLDKLLEVLPPPRQPLDAHGNWDAVETAIGLRLPSDYKAFIAAYGSGAINNCLDIGNPLGQGIDVGRWWTNWAQFYPDTAEYVNTPYPVFPQSGGLLPFGTLGGKSWL